MNVKNIIDVKNLRKTFGDIVAVEDLALQVKKGEIFGFLGPNGSGKTTTMRMLCGLMIPDAGEGTCLGYDILTESFKIKNHVGYMTQRFSYYEDLTVLENLKFIANIFQVENSKKRIQQLMEEFNLMDRKEQLAGTLSGGWKQRLALVASLLHDPELLLLDEPTAGVDPESRREFWYEIHELSQRGITTLVSTHYMDEAERCTRLAYIAHGKLLQQGTTKEIIANVGLTTYSIEGPGLPELNDWLESQSKELQILVFGEDLHVCSQNKNILEKTLASIPNKEKYRIKETETSIEDVFIHLVEKARHEKAMG